MIPHTDQLEEIFCSKMIKLPAKKVQEYGKKIHVMVFSATRLTELCLVSLLVDSPVDSGLADTPFDRMKQRSNVCVLIFRIEYCL